MQKPDNDYCEGKFTIKILSYAKCTICIALNVSGISYTLVIIYVEKRTLGSTLSRRGVICNHHQSHGSFHYGIWHRRIWTIWLCMNDSVHNLSSYEIIKSITLSIPIASNQIKVEWLSESTGLILGLHPANQRWNYFVTTSLVGWSQAQNQSWCIGNHIAFRCVNCVHNGLNTHNGMSFCVYLPSRENILRNKLQWHLYIFIQENGGDIVYPVTYEDNEGTSPRS